MSSPLNQSILFTALTRPQTFAGVTYNVFVINIVATAELFLIFRSLWVLAIAVLAHGAAMIISIREPRIFDLWLVRVSRCPRVRNYRFWQCNSYQP